MNCGEPIDVCRTGFFNSNCSKCGKHLDFFEIDPNGRHSCGESVVAKKACKLSENPLISFPWNKCNNCRKTIFLDFHIVKGFFWILFFSIISLVIGGVVNMPECGSKIFFTMSFLSIISFIFCFIYFGYKYNSAQFKLMWKLIWVPFLGIILILFGMFSISKILALIGLVVLLTWFVSRLLYGKFIKLSSKASHQIQTRDIMEYNLAIGKTEKTGANEKNAKDATDEVEKTEKAIKQLDGWRGLFNTIGIATIIFLILFFGPGELGRDRLVGKISRQTSKIQKSIKSVVSEIQLDLGNDGDRKYLTNKFIDDGWNRRKIYSILPIALDIYMWKIATGVKKHDRYLQVKKDLPIIKELVVRDLKVEQIYKLAQEMDCSISEINNLSKNRFFHSSFKGEGLLTALKKDLSTPLKEPGRKIFTVSPHFQKIRSLLWVLELIIFVTLLIVISIFVSYLIVIHFYYKIYFLTVEAGDQLRLRKEEKRERQREKEAHEKAQDYKSRPYYERLKEKVKNVSGEKAVTIKDIVIIKVLIDGLEWVINRFWITHLHS
ncbi:hypothetical protein ACFL23_01560 [Patescibacteria group bacterium]